MDKNGWEKDTDTGRWSRFYKKSWRAAILISSLPVAMWSVSTSLIPTPVAVIPPMFRADVSPPPLLVTAMIFHVPVVILTEGGRHIYIAYHQGQNNPQHKSARSVSGIPSS